MGARCAATSSRPLQRVLLSASSILPRLLFREATDRYAVADPVPPQATSGGRQDTSETETEQEMPETNETETLTRRTQGAKRNEP